METIYPDFSITNVVGPYPLGEEETQFDEFNGMSPKEKWNILFPNE